MKAVKWGALILTVVWAVISLIVVLLNWADTGPLLKSALIFGVPYGLEFLRILVSWPAAIALVLIVLTSRFKQQIGEFIDRMEWMRAGNVQFGSEQGTTKPAMAAPSGKATGDDAGQSPEESASVSGPATGADTSGPVGESDHFHVKILERNAWGWYFMFLTLFLRPHTQAVLEWINKAGGFQTSLAYEATFKELFGKMSDREPQAVLEAILSYGLIEQVNDGYCITDRGRAFLTFVAAGQTLPDVGKFVPPE